MRSLIRVALAMLVACEPHPSEVQRYTELVEDRSQEPRQAFSNCLSLEDEDLRGDCAVAVVDRAGRFEPAWFVELCPQVPAGIWRDECHFLHAEAHLARRQMREAATACGRAGRFANDCGLHLWHRELNALVRRTRGLPLPQRQGQARRLLDHWRPQLAGTDITWRFWQRFYADVLEAHGDVDPRRCLVLTDLEQRTRCRFGAGEVYVRRLDRQLYQAPARQRFCAQAPATVESTAALLPEVAAQPGPLLEAIVDERHEAICNPEGAPPPDGVLGPVALKRALAEQGL